MEPAFRAEVADEATGRWVRVHGDLDHATGGDFSRLAIAAVTPTVSQLVVDLSACTFLDSGGVRSLVAVERHVRDRHRMVVVSPPEGPARLVLDLVGLGDAVAVVAQPDDVADGAEPPRP